MKTTEFDSYQIQLNNVEKGIIGHISKGRNVRNQSIGLVKKFWQFFFNFPRTVKKVLEVFILRVYEGSMNFFRTITKSWTWTLISN